MRLSPTLRACRNFGDTRAAAPARAARRQASAAAAVINHGADDTVLQIDGTDLLTGAPTSGMRLPQHAVAIVRPREG